MQSLVRMRYSDCNIRGIRSHPEKQTTRSAACHGVRRLNFSNNFFKEFLLFVSMHSVFKCMNLLMRSCFIFFVALVVCVQLHGYDCLIGFGINYILFAGSFGCSCYKLILLNELCSLL